MSRSEGVFDEVLERWLGKRVVSGADPLETAEVLTRLDTPRQGQMLAEIVRATRMIEITPRWQIDWNIEPATKGETVAYVPAGRLFERRAVHASLYADRVLVNPPAIPNFSLPFRSTYDIVDLVTGTTQSLVGPEPIRRVVPDPDDRDELDKELDEFEDHLRTEWPNDVRAIDSYREQAISLLPMVLEEWIEFAWTVRQPTAEGWLQIVHPGALLTDNIKKLRRDKEFWDALSDWTTRLQWGEQEPAFRQLLTAAGLTRELQIPQVITLPSSPDAVKLFEAVARYFRLEDIPYGGVLIDDLLPPPRAASPGSHAEVLRGSWFDELLVGLGPITKHLDGTTACAIRASGTAAALTEFLGADLNQLAFADDPLDRDRLLAQSQRRLQKIAESTVAAAGAAGSATLRSRLVQGGIWGTSGLAIGFIGTLLTGGSLAVAAAASGIGFMLTGAAGVGASTPGQAEVPFPVLIDVLSGIGSPRG